MAHGQQIDFCNYVKSKFPNRFNNCSVLDIGSLDINGNNHYLFSNYKYIGIDVGEGNNVDIVSKGHEFRSSRVFDVVISTECFEHDPFYADTIKNAIRLLRTDGLFIFTCATTGRSEHGTSRTDGKYANPLAGEDYYKNLTEEDIRKEIDIDSLFSQYEFKVNKQSFDLYFWGIKK